MHLFGLSVYSDAFAFTIDPNGATLPAEIVPWREFTGSSLRSPRDDRDCGGEPRSLLSDARQSWRASPKAIREHSLKESQLILPPSPAFCHDAHERPLSRNGTGRLNDRCRPDLVVSRMSGSVKSFGRRLAYESPRGTNPRCVARGLWGFEELRVVKVAGEVFIGQPRTATPLVSPADQGPAPMVRGGKVGDNVWDRRD